MNYFIEQNMLELGMQERMLQRFFPIYYLYFHEVSSHNDRSLNHQVLLLLLDYFQNHHNLNLRVRNSNASVHQS